MRSNSRGLLWGLIGGLVATIVMDIVMLGLLRIAGMPNDQFLVFISSAARRFLTPIGLTVKSDLILGVSVHYLLGLLLGLIYGVFSTRAGRSHPRTTGKAVVFGILYAEISSNLILLPTVMILHLTGDELVQLLGFAFLLHAVWGVALGLVVKKGLACQNTAEHS